MQKRVAAMALLISCLGAAAFARSAEELHKILQAEAQRLQSAGTDKTIIEVVRAQNARKVPLAEIQRIDKEWIAGGEKALVEKLTTNPCAERLRALLVPADRYSESFVMDNQGALVCATGRTSDYWQGDEDKWTQSFKGGVGAIFVDRPRFDDSAKQTIAQISLPVMDNGKAIGAITLGVRAEVLLKQTGR
jgi:hypothetical protein